MQREMEQQSWPDAYQHDTAEWKNKHEYCNKWSNDVGDVYLFDANRDSGSHV